MNQVTELRVADPLRQYTTFYGYDNNARIDSVWTRLEGPGSGLLVMLPSLRGDSLRRPVGYRRQDSLVDADITYGYTDVGQVSLMRYPQEAVQVQYSYDHRKRLTNTAASHYPTFLGWIFREELTYDSAGEITRQRSRKWGSGTWLTQDYLYDGISRLSGWKASTLSDTVFYTYDDVGNRTYQSAGGSSTLYQYTSSQTPNRLQTTISIDPLLPNPSRSDYGYNLNGSVSDRSYATVVGGTLIPTGEDHYSYSYRELPWKYVSGDPTQNDHEEWRYRYNAMGEREQKRMYWSAMADNQPNNAYPWEYYLLSGKQQLSVWAGQQMSLASCDSTGRRVYMYPTEYLSYGVGASALLTTRPNGVKQYKIVDHLGSTRAVVSGGGSVGWQQDYDPYGSVLAGAVETRKGYIDKERDRESGTHNHGVRQYEAGEGGRFLSFDPLWEKYRGWSPYVYGQDNPVSGIDPSGEEVEYDDKETSQQVDKVAQVAARVDVRLNEDNLLFGYVFMNVMGDKRIVKVRFGKMEKPNHTAESRPTYDDDGNINGAIIILPEGFKSMSHDKQVRTISHEFEHVYEFFKPNGKEIVDYDNKVRQQNPLMDEPLYPMEKKAIGFADMIYGNIVRYRNGPNNRDLTTEENTPILWWWKPTIKK